MAILRASSWFCATSGGAHDDGVKIQIIHIQDKCLSNIPFSIPGSNLFSDYEQPTILLSSPTFCNPAQRPAKPRDKS